MKKLALCLFFAGSLSSAFSQKVYFIYLQTENEQAFYVKLAEKVYSSSASGYVVLPKLRDSVYNFSVGFPQNKWPEQKFAVTISKKDHGYIVKNFGEKGWGLFDLQTMGVQMPLASLDPFDETLAVDTKGSSEFTATLALASNDASLTKKTAPAAKTETVNVTSENKVESKPVTDNAVAIKEKEEIKPVVIETPVIKNEESKPVAANTVAVEKKEEPQTNNSTAIIEKKEETKAIENPVAIVKKDESVLPNNTAEVVTKDEPKTAVNTTIAVDKPANKVEENDSPGYKKSVVIKKSESSTTEGFGLVFVDNNLNGIVDTVRVLIPNPKPVFKSSVASVSVEQKKFIDIPNDSASAVNTNDLAQVSQAKPAANSEIKSGCAAVATHDDFLNLRRIMAAAGSDADMIAKAKKSFKIRCYTTEQIRNLSVLFLNDEYKFKFFDAASNSVSDVANFNTLQSELKDETFIAQFKTRHYTN